MKKGKITSLFLAATIALTPALSFAHGGRTDGSGGHKDNKNKSGLGSYHYHCGGYSAHLHNNGVCPYSSSAKSSTSTTTTSTSQTVTPTQVPTTVEFTSKPSELNIGGRGEVKYLVNPDDAKDKNLTWKSSNKDIVIVDSNGIIKALSAGQATITATTIDNKSDSFIVTVSEVEAEGIKITGKISEINISDKRMLNVSFTPSNPTDTSVIWSSSDPSIVEINDYGQIMALSIGTATITATHKGISDSFDIIVTPIMPDNVKITNELLQLEKGETLELEAIVSPDDANDKSINWTVDNEDIASIHGNTLTAIESGNVAVTATTINNKTDTIKFEVLASSSAVPVILGGGLLGSFLLRRKFK